MKTIYNLISEEFTWSYTKIECFNDCPYKFFLQYFWGCKSQPKFYASYGTLMHKLLEEYYKCSIFERPLKKKLLPTEFLLRFTTEVQGDRPPEQTVKKYIDCGVEYLRNFQDFPFNTVGVEKRVNFSLKGKPFVGAIDFLGECDGGLCIIDNKSRDLKPRSRRSKPTLKDEELDSMLRQLYIYSAAVMQEYGKFPKSLCFNCFKTNTFIEEPFNIDKYNEAISWASKSIREVENAEEFYPNIDYFYCKNICGVSDECCYANP